MPIVLAGEPFTAQEGAYFDEHVRPFLNGTDVTWIGGANHQQKAELLRNAAALVFPIQWDEPFGLVMIEAMACGVPVICTHNTGGADLITDGQDGFVTPIRDVAALKQLLELGLADRARFYEIGQAARKVAEGLTWARYRAGFAAAYQALLEEAQL